MSTVRQRHQPIALADILDQDKFDSVRNFHIVMPETRFLGTHPSTCSIGTLSTLSYQNHQDMTPYSSVSSFNYPTTADNTLLTPVSSAGSPPLPDHSQKLALRNAYPHSSSASQELTPPNISRGMAYSAFTPSYDMPSSNSSSPMTGQPHSYSSLGTTPYLSQSPKDEGPVPHQHYLGQYAVSASDVPTTSPDYSHNSYQVDPQQVFEAGPGDQMAHMHNPRLLTTAAPPQAPILAQPDPGQYHHARMHMNPRPDDIQDLSGPPMVGIGHPVQVSYPQQQPTARPKKQPKVYKHPAGSSRGRRHTPSQPYQQEDDIPESITLSDKCEEDLRFIFDCRNKLIESGMKGKGMWEEICKKYYEQYGQRLDKPALQMRHARCIAKYAVWPEKETERLKRAFAEVEQEFHKKVLEKMRENGGARCYNWTESLIEAKLIDLGYEEKDINEQTNTRKRRRIARRRRAAEVRHNSHVNEQWGNNPLGLSHQHSLPQQDEQMEEYMPEYTTEQREEYIESVVGREKPEQLVSSSEPDLMDVSYHGRQQEHQGEGRMVGGQSSRVARQVLEQQGMLAVRM